jgi:6-phosphogluconolactonase (cycloisomerase 2 family)
MTNATDGNGNAVVIFNRATDGALMPVGTVCIGGRGTGGGLGNQGAVILSPNGRWLFAVNAGSKDISVFRVRRDWLTLVDRVSSGGERPASLTLHGRWLYVLNAGGAGNITGFRLGEHGELSSLPDSTRPLSTSATDPAQVLFSPDGQILIVTEKATKHDRYV